MPDFVQNWQCPYCEQFCSVAASFPIEGHTEIHDESGFLKKLIGRFTHCPNPKCKKVTINVQLYAAMKDNGEIATLGGVKQAWRLIPASAAKVFPDYIPVAIRNDYKEACAIKDLSPKASATLARRALQGMIRDFWKITKPRLVDEIESIRDKVDPDTWRAIDGVRHVGNIGAHMEKDVNTIVDVEPAEAAQLISLIEMLLREWYIAGFERAQRLKELQAVVASKK